MHRIRWADLGARPLFFPLVALVIGTWLPLGRTGAEPILFWGSAAGLLSVALWRSGRVGAHLCVLGAFACVGAALLALQLSVQVPPVLGPGGFAVLEGVIEASTPTPEGTRLTVRVARVVEPSREPARFRVRLYASGRTPLLAGQWIRAGCQLRALQPASNPGEWSAYAYRWRRGERFGCSVDGRKVVVLSAPASWRTRIEAWRAELASTVRQRTSDGPAQDVYLTLAAGLRAELDEAAEDRFARSGLAHVLSVSGLHVAALAVFVLQLLRWLLVRLLPPNLVEDPRRWAAAAAVPWLWAYVAFTGWQPPAVRSAAMASLALGAMGVWRRSDALNGLCAAGLAVAVWDAAAPFDLSLQLSFTAVLSLVLLSPALREAVPIPRPASGAPSRFGHSLQRLREAILQTLCASAAVTLTSLPLLASTFHRVSLAGLLSNVVALPLNGALTALAAGGAALHVAAPPLALPVLRCGVWTSRVLLWIVDTFAAMPGASLPLPSLGPASGVLYFAGLLAFALGDGRVRWAGVLTPGVLVARLLWGVLAGPGLTVTFLSVGHGDAVVLSSGGRHALVDGGGAVRGPDPGRRFVVPFLRERQIGRLELAVLSHPHADHALGLISTLGQVPAKEVWIPAGTSGRGLSRRLRRAAAGARFVEVEAGHPPLRLGQAEVEVLGPSRDLALLAEVNDLSVVLRVRHQGVVFLLTGDVEAEGEAGLSPGEVTVMKAPHHGSRTSSTPSLLEQARPRFVVFCVARQGRFGFPHPEVVERYREAGARCYRTDAHGAIRFQSDGVNVRVETFLPGPDPGPLRLPERVPNVRAP